MDVFYLAQLAAGIYRSSNNLRDEGPSINAFDAFYAQHNDLLHQDAWREYYSPPFLAQATSARFYRLPDLRDLPDASDPLGQPRSRKRGIGHFARLLRWAHTVVRTHWQQPTLPLETLIQIALCTLQQTIIRQRGTGYLSVKPYSETQARFWLKYLHIDSPRPRPAFNFNNSDSEFARTLDRFGVQLAQGNYDAWAWEAFYSRKLWDSIGARIAPLDADRDGTRKSEVQGAGGPDGGIWYHAICRGWEPEMGSEEEMNFLAAVALKETEGITEINPDASSLDHSLRSHLLWGVLHAAFLHSHPASSPEHANFINELKLGILDVKFLDTERKAEAWLDNVLAIMQSYVVFMVPRAPPSPPPPPSPRVVVVEDRRDLLRRILIENGQLFDRWKVYNTCVHRHGDCRVELAEEEIR